MEEAKSEAGVPPVKRPTIHLPNGVVVTRIDPTRKETSMLMRIRPGWERLRQWLEGQDNAQRSHTNLFTLALNDLSSFLRCGGRLS